MNNKEKTDLAELFVIEFERYPRDWTRGEMYTEARRIIDLYYEPRATPPLAPCELSAEPSVDECVRVFREVWANATGPTSQDDQRAGIAAVRALFVKEKLT